MATSGASPSCARHTPVKVTTAPISVRPRLSSAASAAASNGSRCRRMVAVMVRLRLCPAGKVSASRHRREEGDLARARYRGIGLDVGAVDGGADHLGTLEGVGVFLAAPAQPVDEIG